MEIPDTYYSKDEYVETASIRTDFRFGIPFKH